MPFSVSSVPGFMVPGLIWPAAPLTTGAPASMQTLIPTPDVPDGSGLDLTALLAAPTSTTLQFQNSLRERLFVIANTSGVTVQVDMGAKIQGQPVNNFPPVTLTSGHLYQFGRFHADIDTPGTGIVTITLSATGNVLVALVQDTGVY